MAEELREFVQPQPEPRVSPRSGISDSDGTTIRRTSTEEDFQAAIQLSMTCNSALSCLENEATGCAPEVMAASGSHCSVTSLDPEHGDNVIDTSSEPPTDTLENLGEMSIGDSKAENSISGLFNSGSNANSTDVNPPCLTSNMDATDTASSHSNETGNGDETECSKNQQAQIQPAQNLDDGSRKSSSPRPPPPPFSKDSSSSRPPPPPFSAWPSSSSSSPSKPASVEVLPPESHSDSPSAAFKPQPSKRLSVGTATTGHSPTKNSNAEERPSERPSAAYSPSEAKQAKPARIEDPVSSGGLAANLSSMPTVVVPLRSPTSTSAAVEGQGVLPSAAVTSTSVPSADGAPSPGVSSSAAVVSPSATAASGAPSAASSSSSAAPNPTVSSSGPSAAPADTAAQSSSPSPPATRKADDRDDYCVKWISFGEKTRPVVTQNVNGPCPLIAIVNVLLLRGHVTFPADIQMVTARQLMDALGEYAFTKGVESVQQRGGSALNIEMNFDAALSVFHKLQTGLDVNVKFHGVDKFEFTDELTVFDVFSIQLYHGWLYDPQNEHLARSLTTKSYNGVVEAIINDRSHADEEVVRLALLAEEFLNETASQLTCHGLCELQETTSPTQLCVFFRNNHFNTLLNHEGQLLLLMTDQGFLDKKEYVWETLTNTEGDSIFLDSSFRPATSPSADRSSTGREITAKEQMDNDMLLALSLSQKDEELAQAVTVSDSKLSPPVDTPAAPSGSIAPPAQKASPEGVPALNPQSQRDVQKPLIESDMEMAIRLQREEYERSQREEKAAKAAQQQQFQRQHQGLQQFGSRQGQEGQRGYQQQGMPQRPATAPHRSSGSHTAGGGGAPPRAAEGPMSRVDGGQRTGSARNSRSSESGNSNCDIL